MAATIAKCGKGLLQLITQASQPIQRLYNPALNSLRFSLPRCRNISFMQPISSPVTPTCASHGVSVYRNKLFITTNLHKRSLLEVCSPYVNTVRTKVRFSRRKGIPKTVRAISKRFYRLNWGIWIRRKAGCHKKLWKKHSARKYRLRQHVFCNKQQSKLLDKMVGDSWKRKRYFVDDPYEIYHQRTNMKEYFPEKPPFVP